MTLITPPLLLLLLLLTATGTTAILRPPDGPPPLIVDGVEGAPVLLPCNTRSPKRGDTFNLVLIFKDNGSTPIYSWDSRPNAQHSSQCSRCADDSLGSRAYFWDIPTEQTKGSIDRSSRTSPRPFIESTDGVPSKSGLVLNPTLAEDAGQYHCRIDFRSSPTVNSFLKLRVVSPMKSIVIRGFTPGSLEPPSTSTASSSLVSYGMSVVPRGASNSFHVGGSTSISTSSTRNDIRESDERPPGREAVMYEWSSALTGRKVSVAEVRELGPYAAGEELILLCEVIGGSPRPSLVWVESGVTLPPSTMTGGLRRSSTTYRIPSLGVADIDRVLSCVGENSPRTPLMVDTVRLQVYIPPKDLTLYLNTTSDDHNSHSQSSKTSLSVGWDPSTAATPQTDRTPLHSRPTSRRPRKRKGWRDTEASSGVSTSNQDALNTATSKTSSATLFALTEGQTVTLTEGDSVELVCVSRGTRPAAAILWTKEGVPVADHLIETTSLPSIITSNVFDTQSRLRLQVTASLHNTELQCGATVPTLPQHRATAAVKVNVKFAPQVTITGPDVNEGVAVNSSVILHCSITAYPPLTDGIVFLKNDDIIASEVIDKNEFHATVSTVVTIKGPESEGVYSCSAANTQGRTISNPLRLTVKYAPRCAESLRSTYTARGGELIAIKCSVDSYPQPTVFRWFSKSPGAPHSLEQLTTSTSEDTLQYRVPKEIPFPTIMCFADNSVGPMEDPCKITLLPAAVPGPVSSCSVHDAVSHPHGSVTVSCLPGESGGLNQSFTLEVRPVSNPKALPPKGLYMSTTPEFTVTGLSANEDYTLTVTASNAQGLSPSVTITYTVPSIEQTGASSFLSKIVLPEDVAPVLLVVIGAMSVVVVCCVFGIAIRCVVKKVSKDKKKDKKEQQRMSSSTMEYTRLRKCTHQHRPHNHEHELSSRADSGGNDCLLQLCGSHKGKGVRVSGCVSAPSVHGTDSCSSYCGDSLSRDSSCRSTTETLLWSHTSDTESQQTFRNSGCYHIDNLTPPECIYASRSPSVGFESERRSLEGSNPELQLINTPRHTAGHLMPPAGASYRPHNTSRSPCSRAAPSACSNTEELGDSCSKASGNPMRHTADTLRLHQRLQCRTCSPHHTDVCSTSSTNSSRPSSTISTITVALNPNYKCKDVPTPVASQACTSSLQPRPEECREPLLLPNTSHDGSEAAGAISRSTVTQEQRS